MCSAYKKNFVLREFQNRRTLHSEGHTIVISSEYSKILGVTAAAFLQQLHYWISHPKKNIGKTHKNKRWVYNRYEDWTNQLGITSERTLRRHIKNLEDIGIVLSENLNSKKSDRTKWYTLDYEKLASCMLEHSTVKQDSVDEQIFPKGQDNLASPSGQNVQYIYRNNITTSYKNTHAREATRNPPKESFQPNQSMQADIVQKMIDIWNEWVEEGREVIQLTSRRTAFLKKALSDKFHNSLDEWKSYCRSVASSSFLMGKIKSTFKATLDWALKFETIQRILEGAYGVKPVETGSNQEEGSLIQDILKSEEEGVVKLIRSKLLDNFGAAMYRSWFRDLKILQQGSVISVVTDTAFHRDCIRNRFESDLQKIISSISPSQEGLCLALV